MKLKLAEFNLLSASEAKAELLRCCDSDNWAQHITDARPFNSELKLFDTARNTWYDSCQEADHIEAYSHHPQIGDRDKLKERFASTQSWASNEQSGMASAQEEIINLLTKNNKTYFDRHGFVFLVCATDKTAEEMSTLLIERLKNNHEEELNIAESEQFKITLLRLQKLIDLNDPIWNQVSQVTTHVLNTSIGSPGKNLTIRLKRKNVTNFETIGMGITDQDGRIANLLPAGVRLVPGHYQMCFETGAYYNDLNITGFYPKVDINFTTFDKTHYHVPLLINPFGYSTYRGS